MKLLGNIIWLVFGGIELALGYIFSGALLCLTVVGIPFGWQLFLVFSITIIGIPFGLQHFKLAVLILTPFGHEVVSGPRSSGGKAL